MSPNTDASGTTRRSFLRGTAASAGAAAAAGASMNTASAQSEPDYGDWFSDVSNFDGTYDFTGKSEVKVTVGAQGNGGAFAFSPAAIRVDPGTKVVWEWTGKGGSHNVVDNGGAFESDMISTAGETYSRTFDSEGTFKYYCQPHKMMGMKGAVVVGGSGGKDPSELGSSSSGGSGSGSGSSGGSGSGSSSDSSGGNPDAKDAEFFSGATIVTSVVMAFLSPLVFAALLFLKRPDDGREE